MKEGLLAGSKTRECCAGLIFSSGRCGERSSSLSWECKLFQILISLTVFQCFFFVKVSFRIAYGGIKKRRHVLAVRSIRHIMKAYEILN